MILMQAISIGYELAKFLTVESQCSVYAVWDSSFFCLLPTNQLVLIYDLKYGGIPFGVSVKCQPDTSFVDLGLSKHMNVELGRSQISVPDIGLFLDLRKASVWEPRQISLVPFSRSLVKSNLNHIYEFVLANSVHQRSENLLLLWHGDLFGVIGPVSGNLDPISEYYFDNLHELIEGIEGHDLDRARSSAKKLIGLGIGLTPSMDDVLLGLIYSLLFLRPISEKLTDIQAVVQTVYSVIQGRTTDISEFHLMQVCRGDRYELLDNVLFAILYSTQEELETALRRLLSVGSTSGSEMLLGVLIGLKLVFNFLGMINH